MHTMLLTTWWGCTHKYRSETHDFNWVEFIMYEVLVLFAVKLEGAEMLGVGDTSIIVV